MDKVTGVDREAADKLDDALGFLTVIERPIVEQAFAEHRLAAQAEPREWRGIESAPKDGTWFWAFWPVHTREDQQQATCWSVMPDEPRFITHADHIDWTQPTHWMPLPSAPEPPAKEAEGGA